jgi:hypothetical protein
VAFVSGKACSVRFGEPDVHGNIFAVVGMGAWKMTGVATDLLESTAFLNTTKKFMSGLLDYGEVTFEGLYDPADTTGQVPLISANLSGTTLTTVRLYVDSTSYWAPNLTADSASGLLIRSFAIEVEKSGLAKISFTGKATGPWTLV